MSLPSPGVHLVPVDGGDLAVEVLPGTSAPVLAVHGISSSRRLWDWLHAQAPDLTLVAPDLRGRGDSLDVTGPSSVHQHAQDCLAVLDALGLDRVVVCGMSMGGFVAVDLAVCHPDRVESLVLVDGGYPMAAPPGLTRESLPAVVADRLAPLDRPWESLDQYRDQFSHTAPLLDPSDPLLDAYLSRELADGRVRLSGAALLADAESVLFGDSRWEDLTVPVRFSHAEWATGQGTSPVYPPDAVERYAAHAVTTRLLPGLDHAGSIMTRAGAVATAELLAEALA
ncbi:MAG: Beta-ketoadipate enol-lactone hydrolase [Frankiales bacterium]|nr:Beta-ketoadipate enol-lactone hydrolase [Frankiales bacterium]